MTRRSLHRFTAVIVAVMAAGCGDAGMESVSPTSPSTTIVSNPAPLTTVESYITDFEWISAENGWGPVEIDRSNGERGSHDGGPLSMGGHTYGRGLGVHANSEIRYSLRRLCTTFSADIGIDDEVRPRGSVVFRVWADGRLLFESDFVTGAKPARSIVVPVHGVSELVLSVDSGGDDDFNDHADWADARLACATPS